MPKVLNWSVGFNWGTVEVILSNILMSASMNDECMLLLYLNHQIQVII